MRFSGSRLVWQSYPGQGIQIQWLGTFGRMNQLFLAKGYDSELLGDGERDRVLRGPARRRHRLGVPVRVRRRAPAVGQRPRPGHRHPGAVARRRPAEGHALVRRRPQRAGHLPHAAAVRRARARRARARTTSPTPTRRASGSTTRSCSRSSGCTTSPRSPTTRSAGACTSTASAARASRSARPTPAPGRSTSRACRPTSGYHKVLRDFARGLCSRLNVDRERAAIRLRERTGDAGAVLQRVRAATRTPSRSASPSSTSTTTSTRG